MTFLRKNLHIIILLLIIGVLIGIFITRRMVENEISKLQYGKLLTILNCVEKYYVDTIDPNTLQEKSIEQILKQLDPHSIYIPAKSMQEMQEPLDGNFGGIGITFNMLTDTVNVINTIRGGPSERVGVMAGDRIMTVNDSLIAGRKIKQDSIMKLLRGKKGTKVKIGVQRVGNKDLLPFTIQREQILIKSVEVSYMINAKVGYIKLNKFSENTYNEFNQAIAGLKKDGLRSLIIDLRDNSGGYMGQAIEILNEFLPNNAMIVYTKGRVSGINKSTADGSGTLQDIPLIVLVDETSASASEIVAGAIQDNDRGTIIGRRTFGKGLVQEPIKFSDGSGLRLTIARYYTASGRTIQRPYNAGDDSYYQDIYQRFMHGELEHQDSVKQDTANVFYTVKGRKVYSGGITPDIFVPLDTNLHKNDFVKLCNQKNLVYKFVLEYGDQYRLALQNVKTIDDLRRFFQYNNCWTAFVSYAQRQGIKSSPQSIDFARNLIEKQLKALIGRGTILDDIAFYYYINQYDTTIQKALQTI